MFRIAPKAHVCALVCRISSSKTVGLECTMSAFGTIWNVPFYVIDNCNDSFRRRFSCSAFFIDLIRRDLSVCNTHDLFVLLRKGSARLLTAGLYSFYSNNIFSTKHVSSLKRYKPAVYSLSFIL